MSSETKIEISAELLRRLHRIHRQRTDLNGQIARGPRQIQAGETLVVKASDDLAAAKEALKHAIMASDDKQLQLKTREARVEELKAKLNTAASNREFNTLKEQIAAEKQANSVQNDEILEAMEVIETLEAELKAVEAEQEKQQKDHEKRVVEVQAKMSQLESELQRVEGELAVSEKEIPAAALGDYKRVTETKGEDALAPVEDESCGGCRQRLTTQHIDRLRMSMLIRCPNCNAFLYAPEDRRV